MAFGLGAVVGYQLADSGDVNVQPYVRTSEAQNVANMTKVAVSFSGNAQTNYAQVWAMTKEHWVRQAELSAYPNWTKTDYGL